MDPGRTSTSNQDSCCHKTLTFGNVTQIRANRSKHAQNQAPTLLDQIRKWNLRDFINENLLLDKVNTIPTRFQNVGAYLESFKWTLVEEVRAQVSQSLKLIHEAPYSSIRGLSTIISKHHNGDKQLQTPQKLKILLDPRLIQRTYHTTGKQIKAHLLPHDLLLLSTVLPGHIDDVCGHGQLHMLALVENSVPASIQIIVCTQKDAIEYKELLKQQRHWYAIYLNTMTTPWRIWDALHPQTLDENRFPILQSILYADSKEVSTLQAQQSTDSDALFGAVREYCLSRSLNESQTTAVLSVYSAWHRSAKSPVVKMIQGPPGTGKTSTIVTLLSVVSCLEAKCLVTAPTNAAIAEVALRYMDFLAAPGSSEKIQFAEFHKTDSPISKLLQLSDVVFIGREEKIHSKGKLQELLLSTRVKRLVKAQRGWKQAAISMLEVLTSGKSYDEKCKSNNRFKSFVDFVKNRFSKCLRQAANHSDCLVLELPDSVEEKGLIVETIKKARSFQDLLASVKDSNTKELRSWFSFSPKSIVKQADETQKQRTNDLKEKLVAAKADLHCHLERVRKSRRYGERFLEKLCTRKARIVFCTVSCAGRSLVKKFAAPFDMLILDEAAQLVEAETAIVLEMPGLKHAILIGDHQQLPATVISKLAAQSAYGRSLFERIQDLGHPSHFLSTQYRMHPSISVFPNFQFYKGRIVDGQNVQGSNYQRIAKLLHGPYAFIDVREGREQSDTRTGSKQNHFEAAVIMVIIQKLHKVTAQNNIQHLSVGVITPYSSQACLLREQLEANKKDERLTIEVNSIDGFQGQEKDIILLSTVRANIGGHIGFLQDHRRMNVAITRARYSLWVVGNAASLSSQDNIWRKLVEDVRERNLCVPAGENAEMTLERFSELHIGCEPYTTVPQVWKPRHHPGITKR